MFKIKVEVLNDQADPSLLHWLMDNGFEIYKKDIYTNEYRLAHNIAAEIRRHNQYETYLCLFEDDSVKRTLKITIKLMAKIAKINHLSVNYARD